MCDKICDEQFLSLKRNCFMNKPIEACFTRNGIQPDIYDVITLTETETDIENKYTEPKGYLCCPLSLCSVNNSTQSNTTFFLSVSVSATVSVITLLS